MFEELPGSVREGGAILRGEKIPSRWMVFPASGVRVIRQRTSLSQSEFAQLTGVSLKTLAEPGAGPPTPDGTGGRLVEHY